MGILKKSTRKILISLAGFPVIILGIILIPLPGPGILVIILGLVILSVEFEWASRYLTRVKETQKKAIEKAKSARNTKSAEKSEKTKDKKSN